MSSMFKAATGMAVIALVVIGFAPTTAEACTSASSCGRYVACITTTAKVSAGTNKFYCKVTSSSSTKNPTCSKHNLMNDWRWSTSSKKCYRTKKNGDKVYSSSNRQCSSGYSYKSSSGKCEKAGSTTTYYSTPNL